MWFLWIIVVLVGSSGGIELNAHEYHEMPKLFDLDEYDACLASPGGAYCLGSFVLSGADNLKLYTRMEEYSRNRHSFNHTRLHRGFCVSSRCSYITNATLKQKFVRCVADTAMTYNLSVKPEKIDYCQYRGQSNKMPVDTVDWIFIAVIIFILVMNFIGTLYHRISKSEKPNKLLMSWSIMANYSRLIDMHEDGDPKLNALNPVQGIKTISLIGVVLAHTCFSYYITYLQNPDSLEKLASHPMSAIVHNGTVCVQVFITISSFLFAYNMLVYLDNNPKMKASFSMIPQRIAHRLIRLAPVYLLVMGYAATWWRFLSKGALWPTLVEHETRRCRQKWWTHVFFVNNLVMNDVNCLIQTWFLAVDFQLYIVAVVLTIVFCKWRKRTLKILGSMFIASVIGVFVISILLNLKPMLAIMIPDVIRNQFDGEFSFQWLYISPWGSLPASILGLFMAFLYYQLLQSGFKPESNKLLVFIYKVSFPLAMLWLYLGYHFEDMTHPTTLATYAALDRPIYVILMGIALIGFFFQVDSVYYRFFSWRGFKIMARLSLPVLMVHWPIQVSLAAAKLYPSYVSFFDISGTWFVSMVLSYSSALLLYLLVEAPCQRFIEGLYK